MNISNPLERYSIIRKINSGGMATVFLAQDKILGRTVALKKLHPHLLEQSDSIIRFNNEAKVIASLSHENIIKIFDFGEFNDGPFLVMEYIDGTTLQECLITNEKLPNLVIIEIARQIISGLQCAHNNGVIHRDIKPANILIRTDGSIVISDFGIAHIANAQSITVTGAFIGSPHFISPEQAMGKPVSCKTDIFSLGVVLYQCITGEMPFNAENPHAIINAIINNNSQDIRTKNRAVLFMLTDLIENCLIKDPDLRPDTSVLLNKIEYICSNDYLKIDRECIAKFIAVHEAYSNEEKNYLFQHYRKIAIEELDSKKIISGLRKFEQAEMFGLMSYEDIKLKQSVLRKEKGVKQAIIILVFLILVIIPAIYFLRQKNNSQHTATSNKNEKITLDQTVTIQSESAPELIIMRDSIIKTSEKKVIEKKENLTDTIFRPSLVVSDNNKMKPSTSKYPDTVLQKKPGFLKIYTNPPWVTMYIDGIERGKTPKANTIVLSDGTHELVLKKEGFIEYSDTITICSSDTITERIRLQPESKTAP